MSLSDGEAKDLAGLLNQSAGTPAPPSLLGLLARSLWFSDPS